MRLGPRDSADWAETIDDAELAAVEELVTEEVLDHQQMVVAAAAAAAAVLDFALGPAAAAAGFEPAAAVEKLAWVVAAIVAGLLLGVALALVSPAVELPSKVTCQWRQRMTKSFMTEKRMKDEVSTP